MKKVKVKIYKRVLLSYEVEVSACDDYDKENLVQAVHEYSPDHHSGWEDEGQSDYHEGKKNSNGVPSPKVEEMEADGLFYDETTKSIVLQVPPGMTRDKVGKFIKTP